MSVNLTLIIWAVIIVAFFLVFFCVFEINPREELDDLADDLVPKEKEKDISPPKIPRRFP